MLSPANPTAEASQPGLHDDSYPVLESTANSPIPQLLNQAPSRPNFPKRTSSLRGRHQPPHRLQVARVPEVTIKVEYRFANFTFSSTRPASLTKYHSSHIHHHPSTALTNSPLDDPYTASIPIALGSPRNLPAQSFAHPSGLLDSPSSTSSSTVTTPTVIIPCFQRTASQHHTVRPERQAPQHAQDLPQSQPRTRPSHPIRTSSLPSSPTHLSPDNPFSDPHGPRSTPTTSPTTLDSSAQLAVLTQLPVLESETRGLDRELKERKVSIDRVEASLANLREEGDALMDLLCGWLAEFREARDEGGANVRRGEEVRRRAGVR